MPDRTGSDVDAHLRAAATLLLKAAARTNWGACRAEGNPVIKATIATLRAAVGTGSATAVFASHDQAEALGMADRVRVMRDGKFIALPDPATLYWRPPSRFDADFIGTPPMNFVRVRVDANTLSIPGSTPLSLARSVPPGPYDLGVRPEHLTLSPGGDVSGEVVLAESLGRERLLRVRCEAGTLRVLTQIHHAAAPGNHVTIRFAWREVHLFDEASGETIAIELGAPARHG